MGSYIGIENNKVFSAVLPAAKNKANEIYKALKAKEASAGEMGNAAIALWMDGCTQIALSLMAQVCMLEANNTDNLNNYASMLTMMGAPELAVPILNNLNGRFKKNSTILNNIGQAWFALGDMDKTTKYLDSTLALAPLHAQANETMCLIMVNKGNKAGAIPYAKKAFQNAATSSRKDMVSKLGYKISANDYNGNFPQKNKSDDLLNLGGFEMPPFPTSVAECKALEPVWKQFRANIDNRLKPLQKLTEESNKQMQGQFESIQKRFIAAKDKTIAKPGSVSQGEALSIVAVPMF